VSTRLLTLVAIAALALACSNDEGKPEAAAEAAPAAASDAGAAPASAEKKPGAADGSPFAVTHNTEGSGAMPVAADTVRVHYEGRLADGTVFDSSIARNEPASFQLSGVIPCWTEGVAQMKVGGKATLVCPPEKAYGEPGVPGVIPANATLTFEVELLGVEAQSGAAAQ
jgi:FKBP-type peptidyl-prolyl cis-trans isomerase FkpA